ncbi:hypothetical protein BV898_16662 [Hypsibius exemplaris]|uniref:Secreted protein n=1 Tax=Hypsibius exemplaris TaxID=2072580 RepID=A0A9X6RLC3_HYPEX|nr:hypothetical protein BV898_16662 [Hypsibius exemplaris]
MTKIFALSAGLFVLLGLLVPFSHAQYYACNGFLYSYPNQGCTYGNQFAQQQQFVQQQYVPQQQIVASVANGGLPQIAPYNTLPMRNFRPAARSAEWRGDAVDKPHNDSRQKYTDQRFSLENIRPSTSDQIIFTHLLNVLCALIYYPAL